MAFVQRANVVLEVKDDAVERMRDMGYSVIDNQGNVLQSSSIKTIGSLENEIVALKKQLAESKEAYKKLQEKYEVLKKEKAVAKKNATNSTKKK